MPSTVRGAAHESGKIPPPPTAAPPLAKGVDELPGNFPQPRAQSSASVGGAPPPDAPPPEQDEQTAGSLPPSAGAASSSTASTASASGENNAKQPPGAAAGAGVSVSRQVRALLKDARKAPPPQFSAENKEAALKRKAKAIDTQLQQQREAEEKARAKIALLEAEKQKLAVECKQRQVLEKLSQDLDAEYRKAAAEQTEAIQEESRKRQEASDRVQRKLADVKEHLRRQNEKKRILSEECEAIKRQFREAAARYEEGEAMVTLDDGEEEGGDVEVEDDEAEEVAAGGEQAAKEKTEPPSPASGSAEGEPASDAQAVGGQEDEGPRAGNSSASAADEVDPTTEQSGEPAPPSLETDEKPTSPSSAQAAQKSKKKRAPTTMSVRDFQTEQKIKDLESRLASAAERLRETKIAVIQAHRHSDELDLFRDALIKQEEEHGARAKQFQETTSKSKQSLQKYRKEVVALRRENQQAETALRKVKRDAFTEAEFTKLVADVERMEKALGKGEGSKSGAADHCEAGETEGGEQHGAPACGAEGEDKIDATGTKSKNCDSCAGGAPSGGGGSSCSSASTGAVENQEDRISLSGDSLATSSVSPMKRLGEKKSAGVAEGVVE